MENRNLIIKVGSCIGILGSFLSLTLIFGSVMLSSNWFSWTHDLLSDIGVRNDTAAVLFNLTPFTSGFLFFLFGIMSLSFYLPKSVLARTGLVVFSIGNILQPLGAYIVPGSYFARHSVSVLGDFIILPVGLIIISFGTRHSPGGRFPLWTILAGAVQLTAFFILLYDIISRNGGAIPEAVGSVTIYGWMAWAAILAYRSTMKHSTVCD